MTHEAIYQSARTMVAAAMFAVTTVLGGITLGGCDLFSTRAPDPPTSSGSNFEPPTSPSTVLRNLENALISANANDYRKCFSDSARGLLPFRFIPSAQGLAVAPTKFIDWGIEQEEKYVRNVFAEMREGSTASVVFNPSEVTDIHLGDSVQFSATYMLNIPHGRAGAEQSAEGQLQFTFRLSTRNEWYISSWRDIAVANKTSWSVIKARFIE